MDSNTICFSTTLSSILSIKSPSIHDQSKSYQSNSTDESTNFVDFQQFNKASIGSCQTLDSDRESVTQSSQQPKKTKIIHKQTNPKKQSQNLLENKSNPKFSIIPSKNAARENPHVQNSKNQPNSSKKQVQKRTNNSRAHSFASIFDWMMEIAAIMKLTRSVFYRACNIFYESYKKEPRVLENSNVQKYVCASLNISAKLQTSNINFLEELFQINKKRISKESIRDAEAGIYKILEWKLPLLSLVSEQVRDIFEKWDNYLAKCEKMGMIMKDTRERLTLSAQHSQEETLKGKINGEILYLLDMMLLNQAKKYMNANSIDSSSKCFYTAILIACYSVFTIHHGDCHNKVRFFMPLFRSFYREALEMNAAQVDRLGKEIELSFMVFGFDEHLRRIPLGKDWKEFVGKDLLVYLPVNVLKKAQM